MVSSIIPGTTGAAAGLGLSGLGENRAARPQAGLARQDAAAVFADVVDVSASAWRGAGDSVRTALDQIDFALGVGQEAVSLLTGIRDAAQNAEHDPEAAREEIQALVQKLADQIKAAIQSGAKLAAGESLSVQAEPGAAAVTLTGVDLQVKRAPGLDDAITVSVQSAAEGDWASLMRLADQSIERVQAGMARLRGAGRSLEAHQGFIGAASGVEPSRDDFSADTARLLALQVRQGLEAAGGGASIANAEPQAVLSLFRA